MKGFFSFAALLLILSSSLALSDGFNSVYSQDGNDVWAVGVSGNVFRSFDGGATWGTYPQGSSTFYAVAARSSFVWMAGAGGAFSRSINNGENFSSQTLGSGQTLRSLFFIDQTIGWIAGNNGTLLKTTNSGSSWVTLSSPTSQHIYCVRFTSASDGWLVGAAGTIMKTTNGGTSWTSVVVSGLTRDLYSIEISGSTMYAVGADGAVARSLNSGTSWTVLDFKLDTKSNVNDVAITSGGAYFIGGGGFIRKSTDNAASFVFQQHSMFAELVDVFFFDPNMGWACSPKNNAVMRTTDGGANWLLPNSTSLSQSWVQMLTASPSIGNTLVVNPWDKNRVYVALGKNIYMSADRGETWTLTTTISSTNGSSHSFYISPKDTNMYVVAYTGGGDQIRRSTNRGISWTTSIQKNFTSYGMPLEMDPDHPDTLLFAPDGSGSGGSGADAVLYRSTNFGVTWDSIAQTNLRSPCDIVIVPDSTNLIYVGDGITGSGSGKMWRSTNSGSTWTNMFTGGGSEIPTISIGRLNKNNSYATAWSSGGVMRTTSHGASWSSIASTSSTWGTDVAKDDPNVVMYGSYGSGDSYLSTNAGSSFTQTDNSGSNYGYLCYDRATFLAQQSGGVWKLNSVYTVPTNNAQTITLLSPNGGQTWNAGTIQQITWTSFNMSNVKIEYQTSPAGQWIIIAASTSATTGSFTWTIPDVSTTQVRVRVSDASDTSPLAMSANDFTIVSSGINTVPSSLAFGNVEMMTLKMDTTRIYNTGTATLVITSVTNANAVFTPGRTSFTIPSGSSDTLSVVFKPTTAVRYSDTLTIVSNALGSPTTIPLSGNGEAPLPIQLASFNGTFSNSIVELEWMTLSEINNFGFEVQNTLDQSTRFQTLPGSFVPGHGTTNVPQTYTYTVTSPPPASYYRLKQMDFDGTEWFSDAIYLQTTTSVSTSTIPTEFALHQSFPNPFNPSTTITFDIASQEQVTIEVFSILGERVRVLVDEVKSPGKYALTFDASRLASGIYVYRMTTPSFTAIRRMTLLK